MCYVDMLVSTLVGLIIRMLPISSDKPSLWNLLCQIHPSLLGVLCSYPLLAAGWSPNWPRPTQHWRNVTRTWWMLMEMAFWMGSHMSCLIYLMIATPTWSKNKGTRAIQRPCNYSGPTFSSGCRKKFIPAWTSLGRGFPKPCLTYGMLFMTVIVMKSHVHESFDDEESCSWTFLWWRFMIRVLK